MEKTICNHLYSPLQFCLENRKYYFINTKHRTYSSENREVEERTEARGRVENHACVPSLYSPFIVIISFIKYVYMHPNNLFRIGFGGSV